MSTSLTAPHVDHAVDATGGTVRLLSVSGPHEAVWLHVRDEDGQRVAYDRATGAHVAAAVMLSPSEARTLARALLIYADSHKDTTE